jgi:hypothetical protein
VAVVVSEETGTISLAESGRLFRGLRRGDLEQKLMDMLGPSKAVKDHERQ